MGTMLGVGPVALLLDIGLTLASGSCMEGALPPADNGPEGENLEGGGAKKPLSRELEGGGAKKPLSRGGTAVDENDRLLVDGCSSTVRRNAWAKAPMLGKRVLGSFASAVKTTSSSAGERRGAFSRSGAGWTDRC